MEELSVVVTMDCEMPNLSGIAGATGPASWQQGERFIRHYAALAAERGLPVSFFIHPEVAQQQAGLFEELAEQGCDADGLHLHPWKFGGAGANLHLGQMDAAAQRDVISGAAEIWHQSFGRPPRYFRPGTFSANDFTAQVLVDLGFVGGSISVPGRIFPDLGAVWAGCPAEPHLLHPNLRVVEGALPFANMPLSVDHSQTRRRGIRAWHPDLRPDQSYADVGQSVARVIEQIIARGDDLPVLNLVTHNDNDYSDSDDPVCRNYVQILDAIGTEAERRNLRVVGATIRQICDRVHARGTRVQPFVPV